MFKVDLKDTICSLRSVLLPPKPWQPGFNPAVLFNLKLQLSEWREKEKDFFEVTRFAQVIFSGNTNVFIAVTSEFPGRLGGPGLFLPVEQFTNPGNHDSCWRSDGLGPINDAYWEISKAVNPKTAPANLRDTSSIGYLGMKPFMFVEIEHVKDDKGPNPYKRILKEIRMSKRTQP